MKHILNNLTEEEKNNIREQHTGGMKVITENFNKLINSKLGDSKPLVKEEYDETLVEEINKIGPIKLYSDVNEKSLLGQTFFSEAFKNPDSSVQLYPEEIKFTSPLGSKSGWKLLVFKCGVGGLKSSGNDKVVYNKQLENHLNGKFCKK